MAVYAKNTCNLLSLIIFISFFLCTTVLSNDSEKYSDSSKPDSDGNVFRRQKINLLWEKAQKKLSPKVRKELYNELKDQDKAEMAHKKQKSNGEDRDGLLEAVLRNKLKSIMQKYKLYDGSDKYLFGEGETKAFDSSGRRKQREPRASNSVLQDYEYDRGFADKKLQKLWDRVKRATTFTEDELRELYTEFEHHQDKVLEYESLQTADTDDKLLLHTDADGDDEISGEQRQEASLKEKNRILSESFARLNELTGGADGGGKLTHPKVRHLWTLANDKGNFTKGELLSIQEELKHFEHKLIKLSYLSKEQQQRGRGKDKDVEGGGDGGVSKDSKHQKKVDDYQRKVDKLHRHLESKILRSGDRVEL